MNAIMKSIQFEDKGLKAVCKGPQLILSLSFSFILFHVPVIS